MLSGPIPPTLAQSTGLVTFKVYGNRLTGAIPSTLFSALTKLKNLYHIPLIKGSFWK